MIDLILVHVQYCIQIIIILYIPIILLLIVIIRAPCCEYFPRPDPVSPSID